jgi:ParB/RepB/Spo0J family partition protein
MTAAKKATAVEVREIPVEQLVVSQDETRKTIDQVALKELSESIIAHGVQEPLLVRPLRAVVVELEDGSEIDCPPMSREKCSEFLLREDVVRSEVDDTYSEIVSGQRRWLAAKMAGYKTVPCIVREMSDADAAEARVTANLQREDLPAIEEAEAYGKLLARPGATIESVAAALAKSPSYVGRRLKLLDAIEPVREALKAGTIEVGHALELARLSERQQQDLLDWLDIGYTAPTDDDDEDEDERVNKGVPGECASCGEGEEDFVETGRTWFNAECTVCSDPDCIRDAYSRGVLKGFTPTATTVAELRNRIARTELRVLGCVPFPLDDEIPPMACTACPKRAAGAASLFADIAEDTCTDPECLNTKLRVWVKAQLEAADRDGRKLAMLYDGHAEGRAGVSRWNCKVDVECASKEPAIWVSGTRIGHLVQICRDKKCSEHGETASSTTTKSAGRGASFPKLTAAEKAKAEAQKEERAKLLKKVEAEKAYRERLWTELVKANVPDAAEEDIARSACTRVAMQGGGLIARTFGLPDQAFDYDKRDEAAGRLSTQPYKQVLRGAALALCVPELAVGEWTLSRGEKPEHLESLAKLFGLDVAAIRSGKPSKVVTKPAKKPAAKPAKKAAKKPAKKAAKKGGRK